MNTERLVNQFIDMARIGSESRHEKEMADHVAKVLEELGMEVTRDNAGEQAGADTGNVYGYLKGTKDAKSVLFSAHMDTVVPGMQVKPILRDGVIYSDGTTVLGGDDKAGIATIIEMIRTLQEENIPHGDIEVLFTICEEVGLLGAKYCNRELLKSKMAYILDTGGEVGTSNIGAPAQSHIDVTFLGKTSHAGVAPENGISAIQMAARAINQMELLRIDEETTANVGIIQGGQATNIVCPKCTLAIEVRSHNRAKLDKQSQQIIDCVNESAAHFGGQAEITYEIPYEAFRADDNSSVVKIAKAAAEKIGITYQPKIAGGGSDANIHNQHGIDCLVLGIGMSKIHTNEEFIKVSDMEKTVEYLKAIVETV